MSLDDVIAKVTSVPAQVIHMSDQIGTLAQSAWGDAVIFELRQGEFQLIDAHGVARTGSQDLAPVTGVKSGRVYRTLE